MKPLLVALSLVCLPLIARGDDATGDEHAAAKSVEQLEVHPELEVKLFASEPMMTNTASIDVDHLGRVWVLESNTHFPPEGYQGHPTDRLLVLQDKNGDGRADEPTVFADGFKFAMSVTVQPVWLGVEGLGLRAQGQKEEKEKTPKDSVPQPLALIMSILI